MNILTYPDHGCVELSGDELSDSSKDYIRHLLDRVGWPIEYACLVKYLVEHKFDIVLDKDSSRRVDAETMRSEYCQTIGMDERVVLSDLGGVSVFEALCTMILRLIEEGWIEENDPSKIVADWLTNLGLGDMDDQTARESGNEIDQKLNIWLGREFKKNGEGSPWVIKSLGERDITKVPMWTAMTAWANEQYPV